MGKLDGVKAAVLVETEFIPSEIRAYEQEFVKQGASVDFLSYLWGEKERILIGDVTERGVCPSELKVTKDISDVSCSEYDIILVAANYVACRLREIPPMGSTGSKDRMIMAPAVEFMKNAMKDKRIVKGFLCHALWILTPVKEVLRDRLVTCHTVVLSDVLNAGAKFIGDSIPAELAEKANDDLTVIVDDDMVTGRSAADIEKYIKTVIDVYEKRGK